MNKITRTLAIVMVIAMMLCLTACGGNTDAPETTKAPENTAAPTTEPVNVCETNGHAWVDATCEAPKTCSLCGETEGEALVSYFAEHGLDAKLVDKSGEYDFEQTCGSDTSKTTVLNVTVDDYKTITSDETHVSSDGYEWKIMSINMRLHDENAQQYGINSWNYAWWNFYEAEDADVNADTTGLFETGMAYPITWNGVEYADGLLHIAESVGAWEQDKNGANYLDIVVTVSVRVPVGFDGFVFVLENYDWEIIDGKYLHEMITDNTLMFRMD